MSENVVDKAVFLGIIGAHKVVALDVFFNALQWLTGRFGKDFV